MTGNFFQTEADQPHRERARRIMAAHPEVKKLFGRNPWTGVILSAIVLFQSPLRGKWDGWAWAIGG